MMNCTQPEHAYIGFGANLGDIQAAFGFALDRLATLAGTQVVTHSALYRTTPVGVENQPDYINAVIALNTTLPPDTLLNALLEIEQEGGRTRFYPQAPRTLDLDLLLYGTHIIHQPALELPHPRMHQRAFVLIPLAEIAPHTFIPEHGTVSSLLPKVADQGIARIT